MNITKRDLADISLVCIAFHFVPYLFNYTVYALYTLYDFLRPEAESPPGTQTITTGFDRGSSVVISTGQLCVMAVFFWFLLFKREMVLNRLFPNSEEKTLALSDQTVERLTDYSFWIVICGLFTGIHAGVELISSLFRVIGRNNFMSFFEFVWINWGQHIMSVVLSILIIWKANGIAKFIRRIGNKGVADSNPEEAGD